VLPPEKKDRPNKTTQSDEITAITQLIRQVNLFLVRVILGCIYLGDLKEFLEIKLCWPFISHNKFVECK